MVKDLIKHTGKKAARKVGDYAREKPAITASFALHVLLVFFVVVGLPIIWEKNAPPPPRTVNIDLLPIRDKTNVKPQEEAPKPEEKKEEEKPKPVKTVQEKVEEPKPEPVPKPKEVEKPKPKPVAKPKEKPKPPKEKPKKQEEPKEDDFAAVLKSVEKMKTTKPKQEKQQAEYDPSEELSVSEMDFIATTMRRQIEAHWVIPAGARDAPNMQVKLRFKVKTDGTVHDVQILDQVRYATDAVFRASADNALRAAYEASPLKDLPAKHFDHWKDNTIIFDPSDMF